MKTPTVNMAWATQQQQQQSTTTAHKHIKHVGKRPKDDQDNDVREKLAHLVKDAGCFYEICPEKLYLVYLAKDEDAETFCDSQDDSNSPFILFNFNLCPALNYEPFNMDFGPFNLAVTHQFCSRIKVWLDTQQFRHPDKYVAVVLEDNDVERKLNATLLVAIAAMVLLNMTDQEVMARLNFFMMYKGKVGEPSKQLVFREKKKFSDVSGSHSLMTLTTEDCIRAFYSALQLRFYDYYEFDHAEYLFYETVMSGDLNWIIPGKILAFAGPSYKKSPEREYIKHPPSFYYNYFRDHNVTTIIRLNDPEYESSEFEQNGFDHHDLIFPDGYPPTSPIAAKFIKIVDEAKGAVAVHCYAGIGRTGTLIAAYMMAVYNFTPQMAVAWTRICRPGSVIGEQQDWLFTKFDQYSFAKSNNQTPKSVKNSRKIKATSALGIATTPKETTTTPTTPTTATTKFSPTTTPTKLPTASPKTTYAVAEKTYGQAKALLLTKKQREQFERPCTRSSPSRNSPDGLVLLGATTKATTPTPTTGTRSSSPSKQQSKRSDFILDLGKTVPFMMYLSDVLPLESKRAPAYYRLKDGKYEWKVKFPEPGYVALKHLWKKDGKVVADFKLKAEDICREPILAFKYMKPDGKLYLRAKEEAAIAAGAQDMTDSDEANTTTTATDLKSSLKLKPVIFYWLTDYIV